MKRILRNIMFTLAISSVATLSYAATSVKNVSFEDQWDVSHAISEQTQWLIFSSHKDGGKWVKESLTELEVTDLEAYKIVYVADISAMPSFITSMFAIPKMQDLAFKIYLDKEGDATVNWPRNQEQVSVYKVENGTFAGTQYFAEKDALKAFLQTLIVQ